MGFLVYNEAFDKYDRKADIGQDTDFDEFAGRNIKNFVERDRNHPSIFIWSVGNEMGDVQTNTNNGLFKLQTMVNYVRKYDASRPVTMACDMTGEAAPRHFDYYDVHSWNYGRRYSLARQMEPNKSVIVSESASTVSTRGFYELPLPSKKDSFTRSMQVSSYDLNAPYWAEIADDDFMWQQDEEYIAGEFVWTGFDYLGEPTPYVRYFMQQKGMDDAIESRSSYFGIVDLCGIPKDRYYLYKSYWNDNENTVHILPHWNWDKKAEKVPIFVYTNGDCAEIFLNGKSLGKQCKKPNSSKSTERFRLIWNDVVYESGELKAIAYREGKVIGEQLMRTASEPYQIKLSPDRTTISASGMDLSYILIEALDKNGNLCPLAKNRIKFSLTGPGHIAGVGNGNPQSVEEFQSSEITLFYGKAIMIVGSEHTKGDIKVSATSDQLIKAGTIIKVE
jgi:beta-galactosidase